ncbi:hypothetical protein GF420_03835, partial [candidate division GN15 bacterium]|nr:hypothetical protein [candidate division GN15 bacterium]
MGTKITIAVVLMLCLFAGTTARAQIVYGQPASGDLQLTYYSWTVTQGETERTISQLAFPLTGFVPAGENFDITLYAANASTTLDVDDGEQSLSGLSDVRVQANRAFADDQLLLSAGVNLPTGKTALDLEEEYFVLQALSQNYLEFPVRRYGEGFGFNVLLAGATV